MGAGVLIVGVLRVGRWVGGSDDTILFFFFFLFLGDLRPDEGMFFASSREFMVVRCSVALRMFDRALY